MEWAVRPRMSVLLHWPFFHRRQRKEKERKEKLLVEDKIATVLLLQYERRSLCSALRASIQGTPTKRVKTDSIKD